MDGDLAQQATAYNTKELYNLNIVMAGRKNRCNSIPVTDSDGKLLPEEDNQRRWKEHLQEVLNRPTRSRTC